jgi:cysteinyl-tRNA synthetase
MPFRLYNTLTKQIEPFEPANPARITFYTCGPTVYDDAHIGNFRSFLAADTLRRWLESPLCQLANDTRAPAPRRSGRQVVHVMNITDVGHMTDDAEGGEAGEDRMAVAGRRLAEAKKSGQLPPGTTIDPNDPYAIAAFYAERFLSDARLLGLKVAAEATADPTLMPRPTQKIPQMVAMILQLIDRGHAYAVGPAGRQTVYFDVQSFARYGQLSGNTLDKLRVGAGGRINEDNQQLKKHPADFLLWKADPSHIMKWNPAATDPRATWGAGYPGWHIECSAMADERLAPAANAAHPAALIDLHSGGEDNIFPHHECEIAQSCCASGAPAFARCWFHPRHLFVNGSKMSKSKGNFFTIRDLTAQGHEPGALRLALISTHYRSNADFTDQGLKDAARTLERWRRAFPNDPRAGTQPLAVEDTDLDHPALRDFANALHDDLNIAGAIAAVNTFVSSLGDAPATERDARALAIIDNVLGVLERPRPQSAATDIGLFLPGTTPDPRVIDKLHERAAARKAKDFARSDQIRDELLALGFAIKDVAGGKVEIRRA